MQKLAGPILDIAGLIGMASLVYGAWLIYRPAGFIVFGLIAIGASVILPSRLG